METLDEPPTQLKRNVSLWLVVFYGLGTILGAGVYALIGKVVLYSQQYTPFAFLCAAFIAFFTVISYAELTSRFPVSAGEAFFVKRAFHSKILSAIVGWMVVLTGIVSAATLSHGFAGYFQVFFSIPAEWITITFVLLLALIAIWGIKESLIIAMIVTLIEIIGLLFVLYVSADSFKSFEYAWQNFIPPLKLQAWSGILSGAFIAFYAFIGFEDMSNIAEEVKMPRKTVPKALFLAFFLATALYVVVAVMLVHAMPLDALSASKAPFAKLMSHHGYSPLIITLISLFAMINGALVQIIMASRVVYGMAQQKNAPQWLGHVFSRTKTPLVATVLISFTTLGFTLWLPIVTLAKITTSILLGVFVLINGALVVIKHREKAAPNVVSYSIFFPIIGFLLSCVFLIVPLF